MGGILILLSLSWLTSRFFYFFFIFHFNSRLNSILFTWKISFLSFLDFTRRLRLDAREEEKENIENSSQLKRDDYVEEALRCKSKMFYWMNKRTFRWEIEDTILFCLSSTNVCSDNKWNDMWEFFVGNFNFLTCSAFFLFSWIFESFKSFESSRENFIFSSRFISRLLCCRLIKKLSFQFVKLDLKITTIINWWVSSKSIQTSVPIKTMEMMTNKHSRLFFFSFATLHM